MPWPCPKMAVSCLKHIVSVNSRLEPKSFKEWGEFISRTQTAGWHIELEPTWWIHAFCTSSQWTKHSSHSSFMNIKNIFYNLKDIVWIRNIASHNELSIVTLAQGQTKYKQWREKKACILYALPPIYIQSFMYLA